MKYLLLLLLSLYLGQGFAEDKEKPKPIELPAYILEVPNLMEFTVDKESSYKIKAIVPYGYTPVIKAYNLPPGAVLASDGSKITWKPKKEDAQDPKNPKAKSRHYEVKIVLSTLEDPKIALPIKSIMLAKSKPLEYPAYILEVQHLMEFTVDEESSYKIKASVPNGQTPLIRIRNLPPGAILTADGKITWKPKKEDAQDPKDSKAKSRQYEVEVTLSTSEDSITTMTKKAFMIAKSKAENKK